MYRQYRTRGVKQVKNTTHPSDAKVTAALAVDSTRLEKGLALSGRRATLDGGSSHEGQEDGEGKDSLDGELHVGSIEVG